MLVDCYAVSMRANDPTRDSKTAACYAGGSEESAALQAVMQLPALVVQALAHALDYVRPLHMEAVLRYGASFKPFHDAHQMSLSPNALRYGMQAG
jgi:uncharacterized membrane protein